MLNGSQVAITSTGSDGSFTFSLPPGLYVVRIVEPEGPDYRSATVTVQSGQTNSIVLEHSSMPP